MSKEHDFFEKFQEEGLPFRLFSGAVLIGIAVYWVWRTALEHGKIDQQFWLYMIIPAYLLIVGTGQLYSGYRLFTKGKAYVETAEPVGPWPKIWKWLTRITLFIALSIAFWAVFFIFVFFMLFPYLFINAIGPQLKDMKKQLIKLQPVKISSGLDYKKKSSELHLMPMEKVIIALGVIGFVIGESFWLYNLFKTPIEGGEELFVGFGILFTLVFSFSLASIVTFGIILAYREFMKRHWIRARMTYDEKTAYSIARKDWRYFIRDKTVWSLLVSNIIIIVWAVLESWPLSLIIGIYWFQSVIIGLFWAVRIFRLKEFSTKDFQINNRLVKPTETTKIKTGLFFLFHYNFFHLIFALILFQVLKPRLSMVMLYATGIFFLNQVFSFYHHRKDDEGKKPNLGKIMFYPYARIIPMHIFIMIAGILEDKGIITEGPLMLVLFLSLKTTADVIMYVSELRGFEDKPKSIYDLYPEPQEPEEDEEEVKKWSSVPCKCEEIDYLEGWEAHEYAKEHLEPVSILDGGWNTEYVCPETAKRWLKEYDFSKKYGDQVSRCRLRAMPPEDNQ